MLVDAAAPLCAPPLPHGVAPGPAAAHHGASVLPGSDPAHTPAAKEYLQSLTRDVAFTFSVQVCRDLLGPTGNGEPVVQAAARALAALGAPPTVPIVPTVSIGSTNTVRLYTKVLATGATHLLQHVTTHAGGLHLRFAGFGEAIAQLHVGQGGPHFLLTVQALYGQTPAALAQLWRKEPGRFRGTCARWLGRCNAANDGVVDRVDVATGQTLPPIPVPPGVHPAPFSIVGLGYDKAAVFTAPVHVSHPDIPGVVQVLSFTRCANRVREPGASRTAHTWHGTQRGDARATPPSTALAHPGVPAGVQQACLLACCRGLD